MNETTTVRRNVEQKTRTTAHRIVIQCEQLPAGLNLCILRLVPKPARAYGDIALGRHPELTVPGSNCGFTLLYLSRRWRAAVGSHRRVSGPARIARDALFVPDPSDIRTDIAEQDGVRL